MRNAPRTPFHAWSRSIRAMRAATTISATRLRTLGRLDEARAAFERAVALKPDYELAIANVAVMWRDAGEIERAEALLRAALARPTDKPPLRAMVVMLAGLLRERDALDEAEPLYERAIAMAPAASAGEWFNLGRVYAERDEPARARDAYRRSFGLDRKDLRGAIGSRLSLPMVYADADDVDARARSLRGRPRRVAPDGGWNWLRD